MRAKQRHRTMVKLKRPERVVCCSSAEEGTPPFPKPCTRTAGVGCAKVNADGNASHGRRVDGSRHRKDSSEFHFNKIVKRDVAKDIFFIFTYTKLSDSRPTHQHTWGIVKHCVPYGRRALSPSALVPAAPASFGWRGIETTARVPPC